MAEIELATLPDRLEDDEVELVLTKLREHLGEAEFLLPEGDIGAGGLLFDGIDDDVMAEFMDRLEISDMSCDYYVPAEFEGRLDCGDYCVGSLFALVEVLEDMMDDLDIEDVDEDFDDTVDEDDYASDLEILQARLRILWRAFYDAVGEAIDAELTLVISR